MENCKQNDIQQDDAIGKDDTISKTEIRSLLVTSPPQGWDGSFSVRVFLFLFSWEGGVIKSVKGRE